MSTDRLLDVFVGVKPDAQLLAATEQAIQDSVNRIRGMFGAMTNQSAAAAQNATNILNGINAGRGAGGAGGGGGNRGGRSGQTGLVPEFEQARRLAQDLQQELQIVGRVIRATGAEDLTNSLQQMTDFLRRVQTDVGRQRTDNDIMGVRQSIDLLQDFRQQLNALQSRSGVAVIASRDFQTLRQSAQDAIFEERVRSRLADSLIVGNPSGDLKKNILEARATVQALEQELKVVQNEFDGTQQSVTRLGVAIEKFKVGARDLGDLQAQAKAAGPSFNTLTNNAYQLGQAIEDFSVGYSLNGFAGGVRGAANNVAFLLNNLVQADYIQGRISEKWKNALQIVFGIGSAVAITILPKLVEWIESLDDAEAKFEDISEKIRQIRGDLDFESTLNRSIDGIRKFAREAENTRDVIKKITELRDEAVTLQGEILAGVRSDVTTGIAQEFDNSLRTFIGTLTQELNSRQELFDQFMNVPFGLGPTPEQARANVPQLRQENVGPIIEAKKASEDFLLVLKQIQADSAKGIVDPAKLTSARDLMRQINTAAEGLSDGTSKLAENLDLADGYGKKLFENSQEFLATLEKQAEAALKIKSIYEREINDALAITRSRYKDVTAEQEILKNSLYGLVDVEAIFVNQTRESAAEAERSLGELAKLLSATGVDQGLVQQVIDLQRAVNTTEIQNTFLERQKKLKDDIRSTEEDISRLNKQSLRDEQARVVTIESFTQQIQAAALSTFAATDQREKERNAAITEKVLELQKQQDSMRLLNQAFDAADDPQRLGRLNLRTDRFSVEPVGAFKGQDYARAWMEPILRQMVLEQSSTKTEVIRKDTTPRAQ